MKMSEETPRGKLDAKVKLEYHAPQVVEYGDLGILTGTIMPGGTVPDGALATSKTSLV